MSASPVMTILFSILVSDIPPFTVWQSERRKRNWNHMYTLRYKATVILKTQSSTYCTFRIFLTQWMTNQKGNSNETETWFWNDFHHFHLTSNTETAPETITWHFPDTSDGVSEWTDHLCDVCSCCGAGGFWGDGLSTQQHAGVQVTISVNLMKSQKTHFRTVFNTFMMIEYSLAERSRSFKSWNGISGCHIWAKQKMQTTTVNSEISTKCPVRSALRRLVQYSVLLKADQQQFPTWDLSFQLFINIFHF